MAQSNVVSLTVPMNPHALKRAAEFFNAMAIDAGAVTTVPPTGPVAIAPAGDSPAPVVTSPESIVAAVGGADDDSRDNDGDDTAGQQPPATTGHPNPGGVDLDTRGFPWDDRIHSGTRAKNKDGSWRQKRNLDDGVVERVEAELRATMAAPTATAATATPPGIGEHAAPVVDPAAFATPPTNLPPDAVVPPPAAAVFTPPPVMRHPTAAGFVSYDNGATWVQEAAPVVPPVVTVPAGPGATATIITPPAAAAKTFPEMMAQITDMAAKGKTDNARIAHALEKVGIPAVPNLVSRPDLIPTFLQHLEALAGI